jgi:glycine cleavage system H protein
MSTSHLKFTEEHEWVNLEGDIATIGISLHAAEELGEIVYVDLPAVGTQFEQMDEFGTVESVKTLSSLYMPVGGEVTEVNKHLVKEPGAINESPYEDGWLVKIKVADEKEVDDLMTYSEYQQFLETL